ncbi:MAG: hypothetical protein ACWGSD_05925, partial [Thermodesulfobacteriota bacterium]
CKQYYDQVMTWKAFKGKMPAKLEDLKEPIIPGTPEAFAEIREDPWGKEMDQGASVRAALALYEKAQAQAWLQGDRLVTADHLRSVAVSTMAGRIKTSPESKYYDDAVGLVNELLEEVLRESKG